MADWSPADGGRVPEVVEEVSNDAECIVGWSTQNPAHPCEVYVLQDCSTFWLITASPSEYQAPRDFPSETDAIAAAEEFKQQQEEDC